MFNLTKELANKIAIFLKNNQTTQLVAANNVVFSCGCYGSCRNTCGSSCYQKN